MKIGSPPLHQEERCAPGKLKLPGIKLRKLPDQEESLQTLLTPRDVDSPAVARVDLFSSPTEQMAYISGAQKNPQEYIASVIAAEREHLRDINFIHHFSVGSVEMVVHAGGSHSLNVSLTGAGAEWLRARWSPKAVEALENQIRAAVQNALEAWGIVRPNTLKPIVRTSQEVPAAAPREKELASV